jgi:hypothetical protein
MMYDNEEVLSIEEYGDSLGKVVVYVCFPVSVTQSEVDKIATDIQGYAEDVGADVVGWYWEMADNPNDQNKLSDALDVAYKNSEYQLLTLDFKSLCPDENIAFGIVQGIVESGGFVFFIDGDSVATECIAITGFDPDKAE